MATFSINKVVSSLPTPLVANSVYIVRVGVGYDQYVTNSTGEIVAYKMNTGTGDNTTALEGLTGTADTVPYFTGAGAMSLALFTNFGRQISATADEAAFKTLLSLNNVSNTSDANKPVSGATQTALDLKVDKIGGKGLSTNDFTTAQQTIVDSLTAVGNTALAAASTLAIGATATQNITISGNAAINAFDVAAPGVTRNLRGSGAGALRVLTYNATSMILPGGTDFALVDGATITMVSLGSGNWFAQSYITTVAPGAFTGGTLTSALNEAPIVTIASAGTVAIGAAASNTISITGTTTITAFDSIAAGARRLVRFTGILILTHNATTLTLPGNANITTAVGDSAEFMSLGGGNWACIRYNRNNVEQQAALALKEGSITNGTTSQYWRGDKQFIDFATSVRSATLTAMSLTNKSAVTAADSVLVGFGKVQAQLNKLDAVVAVATGVMDYSAGSYFTKTISAPLSFTVSNLPATNICCSIMLEITNGGTQTITWMPNITWASATAPTLTAAGTDVIGFYTFNAGTTWRGNLVAKDIR